MSTNADNVVSWFEIPVADVTRAMSFYSKVLGVEMKSEAFGPTTMAVFQTKGHGGVHGALVKGDGYVPSDKGTLIYLNGGEDLAGPLSRVAAGGGKVLAEKFAIGPHGFMALFLDSEGNKLALHSMK